ERSFDTVTFTFSLHHISEGREVLGEAARILKPGGRLILVDMVFKGRWYHKIYEPFWKLRKAIKNGWHEVHCVYRDEKAVEELIRNAGFRIRKKRRMKRYRKGYRDKVYPTFLYLLEKP
ncbi:MAG: methyltransferase domain-containing protein, partial [Candidatus Woesearchaeota archaeon]